MRVVKKIFRWVFDIILFVILGIALIMAYNHIQVNIKGNTYTTMLGYSAFEVSTGSMSGTMEIGDAILVKLIDQNETVNKDEIVVYSQGTALVTHRIVEVNGNQIVTKGDANNTNDTPIQRNQIVGKVIKVIPNFRMWKEIILTPKVLIPASVALLLLWVFFSYDKVKVEVVVKEEPTKTKKKHTKQEEIEEKSEEIEQNDEENNEENIEKLQQKQKNQQPKELKRKKRTKQKRQIAQEKQLRQKQVRRKLKKNKLQKSVWRKNERASSKKKKKRS